ncbi:MAG: hypothetical protein IT577_04800 [Verrucomicrobiae bacterium]|nr:hypothetical protein [Verrucomicrobiae bacterium]
MKPQEIEECLERLDPAAPSAALRRRIAHELEARARLEPARQHHPWRWLAPLAWAGSGAAIAALAIIALGRTATSRDTAANATPQPPTHTREWIAADSPEIAFGSDSLPERRVRLKGVERHEWIDPKTGARMAVESPQDQVIAVPVSFQ